MLSRWTRRLSSTSLAASPASSRRLRSAVLAALLAGPALGLTQFGCDNPTNKADKAVVAATASADNKKATLASGPEVQAAVEKVAMANPQKAVSALPVLGARDSTDPDTVRAWAEKEKELTYRQRQSIAIGMRAGAQADRKAVMQALKDASKIEGASPAAQINPLQQLATLEITAGNAITFELTDREVEAAQLCEDVHRVLSQIRLNAATIGNYKALNPQEATAYVDTVKKKIEGADAAAIWVETAKKKIEGADAAAILVKTPDASVPALLNVNAKIEAAKGEVDKLTSERTQKDTDSKKLLADVVDLEGRADRESGELALNMFLEASKKRQEAAGLALQVELLETQIAAKKHDQDISQAVKPIIELAMKSMDARKQALDDRWRDTQAQIDRLKGETKKLIQGTPGKMPTPAAPNETNLLDPASTQPVTNKTFTAQDVDRLNAVNSVAYKLERLKVVIGEADDLRQQAADLYHSAEEHNDAAAAAAKKTVELLNSRVKLAAPQAAELVPLNGMIDSLDATQFSYRSADLLQRLGRLSGDRALSLSIRADVRAQCERILTEESLEATPDTLYTGLPDAKAVAAEVKKADDLYAKTEAKLQEAMGITPDNASAEANEDLATTAGQMTKASRGLLANVLYARSKVLTISKDPSAVAKQAAALGAAREYNRKYAVLPPGTPEDVRAAMGLLTTLPSIRMPSTAPATSPTSGPSEGGGLFNPDTQPAPATAPAPEGTAPATAPTVPGTPVTPAPEATPGTPAPVTPAPATPAPDVTTPAPPPTSTPPAEGTPAPAPGTPVPEAPVPKV